MVERGESTHHVERGESTHHSRLPLKPWTHCLHSIIRTLILSRFGDLYFFLKLFSILFYLFFSMFIPTPLIYMYIYMYIPLPGSGTDSGTRKRRKSMCTHRIYRG